MANKKKEHPKGTPHKRQYLRLDHFQARGISISKVAKPFEDVLISFKECLRKSGQVVREERLAMRVSK